MFLGDDGGKVRGGEAPAVFQDGRERGTREPFSARKHRILRRQALAAGAAAPFKDFAARTRL